MPSPQAIAFLLVLGIMIGLGAANLINQYIRADLDTIIHREPSWERDTKALHEAVTNTPEATPVELLSERND